MTRNEPGDEPDTIETAGSPPVDRETLLKIATDCLTFLHRRMSVQRFRTSPHDTTKLSYARALFAGVQAINGVLRDAEIADIEKRVADLEQQKGLESPNRAR